MAAKISFILANFKLVLIIVINTSTPLLLVDATGLPNVTKCGSVKLTNKLHGSHSSEIGEFPWIAAIEYRDPHTRQLSGIKCIGSLINNRYVLTAAHCITTSSMEPFRVWLGEWKFSTDPDCLPPPEGICGNPVEKVLIESSILHEGFNKATAEHDIALLRLNHAIQYTDFIQPVCISTKDITNQDRFIAVSWGTTQNGTNIDILQSVSLPYVSVQECEKMLKKTLPANVFCAGGEKGKDTCKGEGGAPLVKATLAHVGDSNNKDLRWFQEGITSWGVGCGREGYPAVYTSTSRYIDWIEQNISKKQF